MKPKIIAFYLPQFHTFPENDEWWGKGFTEWTNVRKASPLFAGHNQPRIPKDDNYYDLSKVETLRWQADLANEYGVHGMCFYHYWFAGKMLLHKPAEMLLNNKDIPMRFCFSWANEPWARTWDGHATDILMPQNYGEEADWRKHFEYLLPFFMDDRYIKEEGRPMFLLYRSVNIPCCREMMELWERMAIDAGFKGMHFVCTIGQQKDNVESNFNLPFRNYVEFEPIRSLDLNGYSTWQKIRVVFTPKVNKLLGTRFLSRTPYKFKDIVKLSMSIKSRPGTYGGVFCGWDNTPRKAEAGLVISTPTRSEFHQYLSSKIKQTQEEYKTNYIFINAWNEWAEGTYLEPDQSTGNMFLEEIKSCLSAY